MYELVFLLLRMFRSGYSVSLCCSVCKCALYYRHRVSTQLQLTHIKIVGAPGPLPERRAPVTCTGFHPLAPRVGTDHRAMA